MTPLRFALHKAFSRKTDSALAGSVILYTFTREIRLQARLTLAVFFFSNINEKVDMTDYSACGCCRRRALYPEYALFRHQRIKIHNGCG